MPWTKKKNSKGQFCIHKEGDDGKPMGKSLSCHDTEKEANAKLSDLYASEGKSAPEIDELLKSVKCYSDEEYVYVPYGVVTLADAFAAEEARENATEIKKTVNAYKQIVDNILYNPDIKNKKSAIMAVSKELGDVLGDGEVSDDDKNSIDEDALKAKKEGSEVHPASHYLVAEDKDKESTWHLRVYGEDGKPDHGLMGAAWAALHRGYRGNKYSGPDKDKAIAKLKKLYKHEGLETPSEKSIDMVDLLTIKSIGPNRVGAYCVLWGSDSKRDLTGEFFTKGTEELTTIFDAVGCLPYIYHHALDDTLKTRVFGVVDTLKSDDIGLWYESQLKMADDYDQYIHKMLEDKKLKTSTQTFGVARRVDEKTGEIKRWPIVEVTATPTPAEYRMQSVEFLKSAFAEVGCTDFECLLKSKFGIGQGPEADQGAEKARWELAQAQYRLVMTEL